MRFGRGTIVASVALTAIVAVLTLMGSPVRVVRASSKGEEVLGKVNGGSAVACQSGELLPAHVSAIRIALEAEFGPRVAVHVYSGPRLIAQGATPPGWTATAVTVPVRPLPRSVPDAKVCLSTGPNSERMQLYGAPAHPPRTAVDAHGRPLAGRMTIEYLRHAHGTWWSDALSVARHMGLGRAFSGSWVAVLVALLVATVAALTIGLAWKELP